MRFGVPRMAEMTITLGLYLIAHHIISDGFPFEAAVVVVVIRQLSSVTLGGVMCAILL